MTFYLGLDLGQTVDYTALIVLELVRTPTGQKWGNGKPKTERHYQCRHIERFPHGTGYPAIVARVKTLVGSPQLGRYSQVIVDQTGVGRPVCDLLRGASIWMVPVTITGGGAVVPNKGGYYVPKRDLVSNLQVLLQMDRLRFANSLPEVQTLVNELLQFQVKITDSANDVYGAWREGQHDDLVMALALAAWFPESGRALQID